MAADSTIDERGKRLRWQCGCRQHGGVMVQQWKPGDPDIDRMKAALEYIAGLSGCECDSYRGYRCLMCHVQASARDGLSK